MKAPDPGTLFAADRRSWREWLSVNHEKPAEVWLVFYKIHTGTPCISYEEAVEEALCFGWIDGKVKRIDKDRYMIRFTPRKEKSAWSAANVRRVGKMTARGLMTDAGLSHVAAAKADGRWVKALEDEKERQKEAVIPDDLAAAFSRNPGAFQNFEQMAPGYRKDYIRWIETAKRPETRLRRIREVADRAAKNLKPGM